MTDIRVPDALAASHRMYFGEAAQPWLDAAPAVAADLVERWRLRVEGPAACGAVALVVPVVREDGTRAVLKIQPVDDETAGEALGLRAWRGRGAVLLLEHDPATGSMLLERLDAGRSLDSVPDDLEALRILSELLARLSSHPAPEGLRRLADIAADLLDRVPRALARVDDPALRRLMERCAGATADLVGEPGDRLLHWDLHYQNVLAAHPSNPREPWLAIDPKPLAGDPGFELLAALHNRWDDVLATGDVERAVLRRFDLMTEVVGLDRGRAAGWTLARVLQNLVWAAESGETAFADANPEIAAALLAHR